VHSLVQNGSLYLHVKIVCLKFLLLWVLQKAFLKRWLTKIVSAILTILRALFSCSNATFGVHCCNLCNRHHHVRACSSETQSVNPSAPAHTLTRNVHLCTHILYTLCSFAIKVTQLTPLPRYFTCTPCWYCHVSGVYA
jgi:hypothetical protein